ncbi:MAG: hypothetical protein J6Y54_09035 [Lentisphaeria bacterium]|nr:hypothetical protein [Lentisphaeria bacterium]
MNGAIKFGLCEYKGAVAGLRLQSFSTDEDASEAEAMDEDGNIEQTDVYGKKETAQGEGNIIVGSDLSALTVGGTITVDSKVYRLTKVSKKHAVNQHATCSFTGVRPLTSGGTVTSGGQVG